MGDFIDFLNNFVLNEEGRYYTDDPDDPGGATDYGITQSSFDSYCQKKGLTTHDVKTLTEQEIEAVYSDLWASASCDKMASPVDMVHYDYCVNAGITQASISMQRVLRIMMDGVIGPQTVATIERWDPKELSASLLSERARFYNALVTEKPELGKYLQGWLDRVEALRKYVGLG